MERRSFILKAGALFSLPLIITEIGCDSYGDSDMTLPNTDDDNFFDPITSSIVSGHSHSVTISRSRVNNPPTNDVTLTTTNNSEHIHNITLTQSNFESLMNGETIIKTSTNNSGHTHTFSIKVP